MHDIVGWAWVAAHVGCGEVVWKGLSSECDWT